jgi:acetyl-CoA carboxylase carboxyltransferase component
VIVRKAYGAGLYAMCGPAFDPDACLALPTASIAVMGAQAAVNAVHYHRIQQAAEGAERDALVESLRQEYKKDVSLEKLASELVVDAVVPFSDLRTEIAARFGRADGKRVAGIRRKHLVPPM